MASFFGHCDDPDGVLLACISESEQCRASRESGTRSGLSPTAGPAREIAASTGSRTNGRPAKTGRYASVGSFFPHFGEEDCLRGWNGSGTIFFSHCSAVARHPALQSEQISLLVLDVVDQVPGDRARGTVQPVRFGFSCFNDVYNFAAAAGGQVIRDQGAMAAPPEALGDT